MKALYRLFKRSNGIYYVENNQTGKQSSLKTRDRSEAEQLLNARNQDSSQTQLNREIGLTYIKGSDPELANRTWQKVFDAVCSVGSETTQSRRGRLYGKSCFDVIRDKSLIETTSDDLLRLLKPLGSFDNEHLKLAQNYAVQIGWIDRRIVPTKLWPKITPKPKRAITLEEHERIVNAEQNVERKAYYQILWETGASQTDGASLTAENIDWVNETISYHRRKLGTESSPAILKMGPKLKALLMDLPSEGPLFPKLNQQGAEHRSAEFSRRLRLLGIKGISLHSYRYAWAERALAVGLPERFAMKALGHSSKAIHHAYAKNAVVEVPALETYAKD